MEALHYDTEDHRCVKSHDLTKRCSEGVAKRHHKALLCVSAATFREDDELRDKVWCGRTQRPHKEDKWEWRHRASTVVTAKQHSLTTWTAERSVSTTPRVQCRALGHRD